MIGAEFLGMIMLIVYVGAVAVLFLYCCDDVKCSSTEKISDEVQKRKKV